MITLTDKSDRFLKYKKDCKIITYKPLNVFQSFTIGFIEKIYIAPYT